MSFVNVLNAMPAAWLALCAVTDWRSRRVPNSFSYGFFLLAALCLPLTSQTLTGSTWQAGLSGMLAAAVLTLPGFVLNRLGGGDVKLLLGLGLATSPMVVTVTFVVATLVLVLAVLAQSAWRHARGMTHAAGTEQPFVPSLMAGYLLAQWAVMPRLFAGAY